ncbi:MAG: PAS domain-containing protein [Paracoccaceae bacterium]
MGRFFGLKSFGNVVAMNSAQGLSNTRSLLWQMEAYWRALPRRGHAVPRRSDVDPRGVEAVLRYAVILERVAPRVARFRIAGQHMTDLTGMEVRGMPVTALFSAASRDPMGDALARMFDTPSILRANLRGERRFGGPALDGQMMLLPLCLENGEVSRAMGAIVTNGGQQMGPQKLAAMDFEPSPVHDLLTEVEEEEAPVLQAANEGFAEPPVANLSGERPHLRVVHSAD